MQFNSINQRKKDTFDLHKINLLKPLKVLKAKSIFFSVFSTCCEVKKLARLCIGAALKKGKVVELVVGDEPLYILLLNNCF